MIRKIALSIFLAATSAALADTYTGNGLTGFGGTLGNSSLSITQAGNVVNFSLTTGTAFTGNGIALYIDSVAGGLSDTSTLTDHSDGGHEIISGTDGTNRTLATFAPGFGSDFALSIEPTFAGLFSTAAGGPVFVTSANITNPSGNIWNFSINLSDIGLTAGGSFNFVASLISGSAYRSNETLGTSTTVPGLVTDTPNAGFNGTTTFSNSNTFGTTAVPEPATILLVGPALLGGMFFVRRRRA
jgi:PEP-CTERM motif